MSATKDQMLTVAPGEQLLPVATVAEKLTGQRPHPTTVCRWCGKGASGVALPSLIVGGKRMTSVDAFKQWLQAVTLRRNAARAELSAAAV